MHSFLILSKDKNTASSYTSNLLKEKEINSFDVNLQSFEKTMGIEDVRNIQKAILLKPFRSKTKAVVIEVFEGITTEAQNALLKILEEPPANTIILILTASKELLLSTVISRCGIIDLNEGKIELNDREISNLNKIFENLSTGKIGDRLRIAQDISSDKESVLVWLEKISFYLRKKLEENYNDPKYLNFSKNLQETYKNIKNTNVSHRTALENLFLSF